MNKREFLIKLILIKRNESIIKIQNSKKIKRIFNYKENSFNSKNSC